MVDLIIDGNYIMSKLVFSLHKHNLLYGALQKSLENNINNYRNWFPFANIYLVSDSKEKSWRKDIYTEYKALRKKDSEIDWTFCYNTYDDFKKNLNKRIKVLEYPKIEGDDWISFLVSKANKEGRSTIIVSNDYDIKQLLKYDLNDMYMNIMVNEIYNKEKLFLPKNYQLFLNRLSKESNDDIFNMNDNNEFITFLSKKITQCDIQEINNIEALMIKIISGDKGDNIDSVYTSYSKNGMKRGIGDKGATDICSIYQNEFGDFDLSNEDLIDNIADIICEKKKLSKVDFYKIKNKIELNFKLIDLNIDKLPEQVTDIMGDKYTKLWS